MLPAERTFPTRLLRSRHTSRLSRPRTGARDDEPAAEALIGRSLGSYRVLALRGEGGMGRVYEAEHALLRRRVALKVLLPSLSEHGGAVSRFFQEARVVNRIRHPNIVDVTDFVELADGTAFLVMELLDGSSLRDRLRDRGPLPIAEALSIADQVCAGLQAAHAVGVVHRDLKPGNIYVRDNGSAVLLDFGIAKLGDLDDELGTHPRTAEGAVLGTPAYMSPEQAVGEELDGRSDIYSLGVILYELVCGEPPFCERRFVDFAHKHTAVAPRPPRSTRAGRRAPRELEDVIMRCLRKNPDDRYPDVAAVREALRRVRARRGVRLGRRARIVAVIAALAGVAVGYAATRAWVSPSNDGTSRAIVNGRG